jgi:hypothetical protein
LDQLVPDASGETMRQFYDATEELQKKSIARTGGRVDLPPSQQVGSRELAVKESAARQIPGQNMNPAQAMRFKAVRGAEKNLNAIVGEIASDTSKIGKSEASGVLTSALEDVQKKAIGFLRDTAKIDYGAVSEKLGGTALDTTPTLEALDALIKTMPANGSPAISAIKNTMKALTSGKNGKEAAALFEKIRAEQVYWGGMAHSDGTIIQGLDNANARRIANEVHTAIGASLDMAEKNGVGEGYDLLRKANANYKKNMQAVKDLAPDVIKNILKLEESGAGDLATKKLAGASETQIESVFAILEKDNPEAASQVRAQVIEDFLTKSGKPTRAMAGTPSERQTVLRPLSAYKALTDSDNASKINAMFRGKPKDMHALNEAREWLRRVSFGPNLENSQTPSLLTAAAGAAADMATNPTVSILKKIAGAIIRNDKAFAENIARPGGLELFNSVMRAGDDIGRGQQISQATINKLLAQASSMGLVPEKDQQQ